MGGSVSVDSELGKGSSFNINFKSKFSLNQNCLNQVPGKKTFIKKPHSCLEVKSDILEKMEDEAIQYQSDIA